LLKRARSASCRQPAAMTNELWAGALRGNGIWEPWCGSGFQSAGVEKRFCVWGVVLIPPRHEGQIWRCPPPSWECLREQLAAMH
ncbi:MAG TPA: hypothetical protein VEQ63_13080, partial [Bryobacteraceae bacterium]|nr:hypothetical protein [Bryobacteraceae bacterium]